MAGLAGFALGLLILLGRRPTNRSRARIGDLRHSLGEAEPTGGASRWQGYVSAGFPPPHACPSGTSCSPCALVQQTFRLSHWGNPGFCSILRDRSQRGARAGHVRARSPSSARATPWSSGKNRSSRAALKENKAQQSVVPGATNSSARVILEVSGDTLRTLESVLGSIKVYQTRPWPDGAA